MRKNLLVKMLPLFLMLITSIAWGQERVVSGKVTSADDGSGLPGVNVLVKGTTNGTVSDSEGNFRISMESQSGGLLVFSFIGYQSQEVEIGQQTNVTVKLANDVQQLSEVIVVGQGLSSSKKALGYSVTTVGSDQLASRPVNDISRVLQGKVAGVVINPTGGITGSGASINIRGLSSLTGNTQPLWVVDGVPFNSNTNQNSGFSTGGAGGASSRFLDIDPNTIESINVLQSLASTVLYGDQGRNGVILVTTKSGATKKGLPTVSFQQTTSLTEIASAPKFQNEYGVGFQQLYGAFFSNWGPHFSEIDSVGHPYQFLADPELQNSYPKYFFKRVSYEAAPNILGFFRKGISSNSSLNLSGGTEKLAYNASVAYTKEEGYTPGNDLKRLNISTGFTSAVNEKLTIKISSLFAFTDNTTPPLNGATGGGASFNGVPSIYANFLYTPRNIDILNWEYETPTGRSIFYRGGNDIPNGRWLSANTKETDVTTRFFNTASFVYDFSENMNLTYRIGLDSYTQRQTRELNKGIGPTYAVIDRGVFQSSTTTNRIWNHDLLLTFDKRLTNDIKLTATIGANARNDFFLRDGLYSEGQSVAGDFRHSNFSTASSRDVAFGGNFIGSQSEQQRYGVLGNFVFDYRNFLNLTLAGRNDWNSAHEAGHNTQFYPSVSAAFNVTEAFSSLRSSKFNFLKVRANYGTSAGFANPYSTRTVIGQNLRGFLPFGSTTPIPQQTIGNIATNLNLNPELVQEVEAGIEAKFFNERLGLDVTVYDKSTKDLITLAPIDPTSGFTSTWINVGKLSNKGINIALNGSPIRTASGFEWDVIWNFTKVNPLVEDLGSSISEIVLAGFTTRGNFAIKGQPTNIIKGSGASRSPDGQRVVGADGQYLVDPNLLILGNPNPDYTTTLINTFSFKGVSLSFQWDYRHRGAIYNSTASALIGRGVTTDVTNFNHDNTFILPGVRSIRNSDGTTSFQKNDIQITAADYGFNTQFFADEVGIFDGSTIRLREVSLSYSLPKSILVKTPLKSVSVTLNGNNLWFNAINVPKGINYDTEVGSQGVGNGAGFDYLTGPSVRRYGAVIKLTF
jgi:TonB-linked SusC/RagA family outer membrane protein